MQPPNYEQSAVYHLAYQLSRGATVGAAVAATEQRTGLPIPFIQGLVGRAQTAVAFAQSANAAPDDARLQANVQGAGPAVARGQVRVVAVVTDAAGRQHGVTFDVGVTGNMRMGDLRAVAATHATALYEDSLGGEAFADQITVIPYQPGY